YGGQLDERVRVGAGNRLAAGAPAEKPARANELDDAQERGQGVLAGALDAHEARLTEAGIAGLRVERVPMQNEPLLLGGQAEPAVTVGAVDVLVPPLNDLPPNGLIALVLRVDPAIFPGVAGSPVRVLLPHLAVGVDVFERLRPGGHERIHRHVERGHFVGSSRGWLGKTSASADSRAAMRPK